MLLLLCVTTAVAGSPRPHTELGVGPALVYAPFRDAQVSPRRAGGGTGGFALSLDTLDAGRYDRVTVVGQIGQGDGWRWNGVEIRTTLAPDVADVGDVTVRVGVDFEGGYAVRSWVDNLGWRAHVALGPAVGLAWRVHEGERARWTTELVASTPLVGMVGRPGWGGPTQGGRFLDDYTVASLNRLRGGRALVSLLLQREGRASIRFQAELSGRVVPWRHRLAEVSHVLTTLLYWRL